MREILTLQNGSTLVNSLDEKNSSQGMPERDIANDSFKFKNEQVTDKEMGCMTGMNMPGKKPISFPLSFFMRGFTHSGLTKRITTPTGPPDKPDQKE